MKYKTFFPSYHTVKVLYYRIGINIRSGAHYGEMLLVRIVESNKIDDYLGQVRLSKG